MNEYEKKQADRKARMQDRADSLQREANATHTRARKMAEAIPFGQPIQVGHHSEKRDRNYRGKIHNTFGKAFALQDHAQEIARKAAAVGTGGISSDDPDAIAKLRAELDAATVSQERMKAANKAIRANAKKGPDAQVSALVALGFSEAAAREAITPDFCNRVGFPAYALSNNSANMRRIEQRIAALEATRKRSTVEKEGAGFTYREDTEENRVMFQFPGKPAADVRDLLKRHAFVWSPSRDAWVRKLTPAAIYAGKEVFAALSSRQAGDSASPK